MLLQTFPRENASHNLQVAYPVFANPCSTEIKQGAQPKARVFRFTLSHLAAQNQHQ